MRQISPSVATTLRMRNQKSALCPELAAPAPAATAPAAVEAIRMGVHHTTTGPLCGALSAWPLERVKGAL